MFMFIAFARKAKRFFSPLFRNNGEFGAKKYFTDHRAANTNQLFVVLRGNFSGLFFFKKCRCKRELPRD